MSNENQQKVELELDQNLAKIFSKKLTIPDYQRIYCWEEKNVYQLLEDVINIKDIFHMGNIIVNVKGDNYDIIDGQQRLVTLSLILYNLENSEYENPLLKQKFKSTVAQNYVIYNNYIIKNYIKNHYPKDIEKKVVIGNAIREKIQFSMLELKDDSLDLAYTFFSSQNSLGVKLSDYDLLKSHHLRYVVYEDQALHIAKNWDKILINSDSSENIKTVIGMYLFRLRKWFRHESWVNNTPYLIKEEFEAANIIPEIPPFGEQFLYYEPIQGGTHFFAYTDIFIERCKLFHSTSAYKALRFYLTNETHYVFCQVIEILLFAYYLKFGEYYLNEALFCITRIISDYRFKNSRYNYNKLINHENNIKVLSFIHSSSSPTFFLAAASELIKKKLFIAPDEIKKGIATRYYGRMKKLFCEISKDMTSTSIRELVEKECK